MAASASGDREHGPVFGQQILAEDALVELSLSHRPTIPAQRLTDCKISYKGESMIDDLDLDDIEVPASTGGD